jgi:hypothetical protein
MWKQQLQKFVSRNHSEILMWILIAEMMASPLADGHPRIGGVLAVLVLLTVLAGAKDASERKIIRFVVLPIACLWLAARFLQALCGPLHVYAHMAPVFGLALSVSILSVLLERFQSTPCVLRKTIAEAFISYLVIAIAFSQLYWILSRIFSNPFTQPIAETQSGTFLYFSMIALTSVGYGGIAPLNPYVRMVASFESAAGIFYIAVVVARLVSSYHPTPAGENRELAGTQAN